MKNALRLPLVLATLIAAIFPWTAHAQPGGSRAELEQMFANISQKTEWDMSKNMLWGYFFTNPSREPLTAASQELSRLGYRVVNIYLSDKDDSTEPDMWWLHVERIEPHTVASLYQRNAELTAFAKRHGLGSYDGMDVGPASN